MHALPTGPRSGFTLVEISLAILVVGVGLLAVFGLFPSGLEASRKAIGDTRSALFAEEALNGFLSVSEFRKWDELDIYDQLAPPGINLWENSNQYRLFPDGFIHTNVYQYIGSDIVEYAVRYRLDVGPPANNIRYLRLEIWNGEYGREEESTVYYTEIYNTGIE